MTVDPRYLFVAWLPLLSLACGQADPPEEGNVDGIFGDSHYPLSDGARWVYLHTRTDSTQWSEEVTLDAVEYGGAVEWELSDTANPKGERSDSVLVLDDEGATRRVHKTVTVGGAVTELVDYDPGFLRFDAQWHERMVGFVEEREYVRTATDATGANPTVEDRTQRYTIEGKDQSVDVPAGHFTDCLMVRRERVAGPERDKMFWFCRGVGKVRELNYTSGTLEALLEYELPEAG